MSFSAKPDTWRAARALLAATLLGLACLITQPALGSDGEALYLRGQLLSGAPLKARRGLTGEITGADGACVNCHLQSGLGSVEGRLVIPPISGAYLLGPSRLVSSTEAGLQPSRPRDFRAPYDDASLARAIRDGVGRDGHALDMMMPRFELGDADMNALIAYLRKLSASLSPGVESDTLHFATVITPDSDPARAKAMLAVLEAFFADKNAFIRGGMRQMRSNRSIPYRVTRQWALHVWRLSGDPSDWARQLERHMAEEPVFAIVSGLAGRTWQPVHRFCEQSRVPCLFPNVDLPVEAESDFYSLYFSKGVLLEAELLARAVRERRSDIARLIVVYREGDVGADAAAALQHAVGDAANVVMRPLAAGPEALARSLADVHSGDAVALWLRPGDIEQLPRRYNGRLVLVSGLMAGLDHAALPGDYRSRALMSYPVALPAQRKVGMEFPLRWLAVRKIALTDELLQSDTWLACRILAESLGDMGDNFYRDYLVEQVQAMLSRRPINAYYPRLGMARGQRFASKGGYLVRFGAKDLDAVGDWIVP